MSKILTPLQANILDQFSQSALADIFVFGGGTALAEFYLYHRLSDDLDFFVTKRVPLEVIQEFIQNIKHKIDANDVSYKRLYDRNIFTFELSDNSKIQLEYTYYPFQQLDQPKVIKGVKIESLRDLVVNKFAASLDRFEPKDYFDLYIILKEKHSTLSQLSNDYKIKFGSRLDPITLGAMLQRSKNIRVALPHMLQSVDVITIQDFFDDLKNQLDAQVLEDENSNE